MDKEKKSIKKKKEEIIAKLKAVFKVLEEKRLCKVWLSQFWEEGCE